MVAAPDWPSKADAALGAGKPALTSSGVISCGNPGKEGFVWSATAARPCLNFISYHYHGIDKQPETVLTMAVAMTKGMGSQAIPPII
jgi:hypothetical protein